MSSAPQRPVIPTERIVALDVIRGLAMSGVLVAYCMWSLGTRPPQTFTALDHAFEAIVTFAVDGKFYTLLAFLFGLGFHIQMSRSVAADVAVRLYHRRLWVLAAFGLAHAVLLRNGDILLPYALTGFLLAPFRYASDRTLLGIALAILFFTVSAREIWAAAGLPIPERPSVEGSYLVENFAWVRYWYATAIFNWPLNLTLFLLGLYAGRHDLVIKLANRPDLISRILVASLTISIALFAALTWLRPFGSPPLRIAANLLVAMQAWSLAMTYVSLALFMLCTRAGGLLLGPFAAVGRMALTNYLMQAALIVPFCLAFDLFDQFTPTWALGLALATLAIQVLFSVGWLNRHDFGPVEWLWRLLTYGELPGRETRAEPAAQDRLL